MTMLRCGHGTAFSFYAILIFLALFHRRQSATAIALTVPLAGSEAGSKSGANQKNRGRSLLSSRQTIRTLVHYTVLPECTRSLCLLAKCLWVRSQMKTFCNFGSWSTCCRTCCRAPRCSRQVSRLFSL